MNHLSALPCRVLSGVGGALGSAPSLFAALLQQGLAPQQLPQARLWQGAAPSESLRQSNTDKFSVIQKRHLHLAPPFLLEGYVPAAQTTYRLGRMPAKLAAAQQELSACNACPRKCGVNRLEDSTSGQCHVGRHARVASVFPHFGEESVVQGYSGSGAVFFGGCNLRCVFCQNWDISQSREAGDPHTPRQLADWMLKLQDEGACHNVNFITPEHVAPQVAEAIADAVSRGFSLPVIYNTSAYDSLSSLALMEGLVDIYLPDFKFWDPATSARLCKARDYPDAARAAIKEMHRQVGDLCFNGEGIAQRGLLVRHLAMPGLVEEGKAILSWLAGEVSRDTYVHIMEQYRPHYNVGKGEVRARGGFTKYEEIDRPTSSAEVAELLAHARAQGLWRFEEPPRWDQAHAPAPDN